MELNLAAPVEQVIEDLHRMLDLLPRLDPHPAGQAREIRASQYADIER